MSKVYILSVTIEDTVDILHNQIIENLVVFSEIPDRKQLRSALKKRFDYFAYSQITKLLDGGYVKENDNWYSTNVDVCDFKQIEVVES